MQVPGTLRKLVASKQPEPSYPVLPAVDRHGESNIPGVYVLGELAGTPLVKLGLNAGHDLVQRIGPELAATRGDAADGLYDLVIVGSGSSGLAATIAAKDLGLRTVTLEAASFANTFVTMTKGKWLFAEPEDVPNRSRVWFEECTKEELLDSWRKLRADENLDIREYERVTNVTGRKDDFLVESDSGTYRARRVLLCMGKAGNPRKLGIPGEKEHGDRIHHRLLDADDFRGRRILIVGAGDVACEAAIALAADEASTVTLSAIDTEFTYPKKRNIDAVRELEANGRLRILLGSSVKRFDSETATIRLADGSEEAIPYDSTFEMIGAELPIPFFRRVGIRLANSWNWKKWAALIVIFLSIYSLYALKQYGKGPVSWPYGAWSHEDEPLIPEAAYDRVLLGMFDAAFAPFAWVFEASALADIRGDRGFQQGYLYSLLYTILMVVFGYLALLRWTRKAKRPAYQKWRYISLISFQVGFFLIVNVIAVQALSVQHAWRAWGLYQPYPLFFNTFFWWDFERTETWIVWFFIGAGIIGSLVMIPFLARNHGKRFCTWVCGCGGLAETLGDRWRHLSAKGERSRSWEFQATVIFLASVLVLVVIVGTATAGDHMAGLTKDGEQNPWWVAYNYLVDFWLVAVIPIALYPFFGGKVWCRYWCPLAAYNQLLSKWYGRLKIVSNDKCITCTECSKYCQVGVDVMSFAKNQQPFDNTNSGCIHCGICIDVCPVSVLSFETSTPKAKELIAAGHSSGA